MGSGGQPGSGGVLPVRREGLGREKQRQTGSGPAGCLRGPMGTPQLGRCVLCCPRVVVAVNSLWSRLE